MNIPGSFYPDFLSPEHADTLFSHLKQNPILLEPQVMVDPVTGESFEQGTSQIWFHDPEIEFGDMHSGGQTHRIFSWDNELQRVFEKVNAITNQSFQVGVCLWYKDGLVDAPWHYDPPAFGKTDVIASLNLGATRLFGIREKETGEVKKVPLTHGSLYVMEDGFQKGFEHCIFAEPEVTEPRINITFRKFGDLHD